MVQRKTTRKQRGYYKKCEIVNQLKDIRTQLVAIRSIINLYFLH